MCAEIALATPGELTEIQQFWYRIYVLEMQRHRRDPLADHRRQTLSDPLAEQGSLFVARSRDRQIVATLMTTVAGGRSLGKYERLYGLDLLSPTARLRTSITTKLMVAPEYRRGRLPMQMARATYEHALALGVECDYIDCNDHLVSFFSRLGYRPHLGPITHRDYGTVNSMVLHLTDSSHLQRVQSPFIRSLERHLHSINTEVSHVAA